MRLIDADKLLEKTECLFKDLNSTEDYMGIGYNHGVGDSIAVIKNAPTIEVEPVKHGRWECESDLETYTIWRCSECGIGFEHTSPYCRYCGAKMGGEEA